MNPSDRAALFNDDGRSDYVPAGRLHPWRGTGAATDPRPVKSGPRQREREQRYRQRLGEEEFKRRQRARAARHRAWRPCLFCETPCTGQGGGLCHSCSRIIRARAETAASVQRDLAQPFRRGRSPTHERNVARLVADQQRLPL